MQKIVIFIKKKPAEAGSWFFILQGMSYPGPAVS
jgi:hypothetical protein